VETFKLKIQKLRPEAFAPFGVVLQPGDSVTPEFVPGERPGLELFVTRRMYDLQRFPEFTVHFAYSQTMAILKGSLVLVVAAPPNPQAPPETWKPDYNRMGAFLMNQGEVLKFAPGAFHNFQPLGETCEFLLTTARERRDAKEKDRAALGEQSTDSNFRNLELIRLAERGCPVIELVL